jgi:integrase/recombinase XerC
VPKPASDAAMEGALSKAGPMVTLMVRLGERCGLRAMEIAGIHTRDLEQDELGWTLRVLGKGSKVRIIPLSDDFAAELLDRTPGYIFPGAIEGHLSPAYVSRLVSSVLPAGVTAHKLRHRFATKALRGSNNNLRAVQELLGHSSIATTQIYTGIGSDQLRQAALSAS